jgi:hypothetical protein
LPFKCSLQRYITVDDMEDGSEEKAAAEAITVGLVQVETGSPIALETARFQPSNLKI